MSKNKDLFGEDTKASERKTRNLTINIDVEVLKKVGVMAKRDRRSMNKWFEVLAVQEYEKRQKNDGAMKEILLNNQEILLNFELALKKAFRASLKEFDHLSGPDYQKEVKSLVEDFKKMFPKEHIYYDKDDNTIKLAGVSWNY